MQLKMPVNDANYLRQVREQYETYPYPSRNPENERIMLHYVPLCALERISYYHYSGNRDFTKGFRALVAGGGTGDAVIMLAEQLKGSDTNVVYLDISDVSMQVARARANMRGLTNITWVHGSILDAPKLLEGKFDYIDCVGVLHHLASPDAGLAALASVLKDNGLMGLMLYGKHGRAGIYQLQSLMKILNKDEQNMQKKVENCKSVLKNLPASNPFKQIEGLSADIKKNGDTGIYDLLLHSNDIPYSIPGVYIFLASAGLKLTHLAFSHDPMGSNLYRLEAYISDGQLAKVMSRLSIEEKQAAAELLHGQIGRHAFYAARVQNPLPLTSDLDNVPYLHMASPKGAYNDLSHVLKNFNVGQSIRLNALNRDAYIVKSGNAEHIFKFMDGKKSIREIFRDVEASYPADAEKPAIEELAKEFDSIFAAFHTQDWMFLRDKSVPATKTIEEIRGNLNLASVF